ncbi:MAG: CBS domain-containing protein [Candidatus Andersenbacteria bacterium]|nr:CBS domain-containing protein [Candidatus Andersenbacteria bacterium]
MNQAPTTPQPRTVQEIMSTDVQTFSPSTSVREMAATLIEEQITGAPVVDGGKVVGIVTEADLVMQKARLHMPHYISLLDSTLFLEDPSVVESELNKITGTTAEQLMTTNVVTIRNTATIEDVATLFEEEHVNPVPVLDENELLVGVVSRADIVSLLARTH